jgi:hypothetical protein
MAYAAVLTATSLGVFVWALGTGPTDRAVTAHPLALTALPAVQREDSRVVSY